MLSGIAASIVMIAGLGWTAAFTFPTNAKVQKIEDKVIVAEGKADYLLIQQIDSVKSKQSLLREKHKVAPSSQKKSIELEIDYWKGEQERLEKVKQGDVK